MSCIAGPHQFGTEDQGWVAHFLYSALMDRKVFIYGDGKQVRDVLCVHDLIRAFEAVRTHVGKTGGEIYNVGGGIENAVSLLEILDEIEEVTGTRLQYQLQSPRPGDQLFYVTNYSKLREHVGWQPRIDVRETLETMHAWWKANRELFSSAVPAGRMPAPAPALQHAPEIAS
jgi:CDP-paratose 2-epimerase